MSEASIAERASNPDPIIRAVLAEDIDALHPVFETWIRDRDTGEILTEEISELEAEIRSSIEGVGERKYFVAEDSEGKAVGIMGMQAPPYKELMRFTTTSYPMETINAYVADDERLGGTGRNLARYIEALATQQGYTELLVNSGPRYEKTGWPFWTKLYGEPTGVAVGLYGPGGDAKVWRRDLSDRKVTYFAVDPTDPTGESITFGRGDPDDPNIVLRQMLSQA